MSLSIAHATLEAARALRRAGVAEARLDAALLLAHIIGCDRAFLIAHAEDELQAADVARFREFVERRAAGEPLQYITGRQEFFGLDFVLTPDVLIPRPETELLVEKALELLDSSDRPTLLCDVGTGSGCIGVAILHERKDVRGVGLDISPHALRVAARNAARHNVRERFSLVVSDCFAALDERTARFNIIVSNPPYVSEDALASLQREVREHEPRVALTPGADGLRVIRRLLTDAPQYLNSGGHLLIEIGFDQHSAVTQLIDTSVWTLLDIHRDLQGIPRTVVLKKR